MNKSVKELEEKIHRLELLLLHADLSVNPELPGELLSEEFEEIGSSGWITAREQVIDWLKTKKREERWEFAEFGIKVLSKDLVLATYLAIKVGGAETASKGSRRSSIWKRTNNRWRMIFHQATKVV